MFGSKELDGELQRLSLAFSKELGLPVCKPCGFALRLNSSVLNHLERKHNLIACDSFISALKRRAGEIPDLKCRTAYFEAPEAAKSEHPPLKALENITLHRDGWKCSKCEYYSPLRNSLTKHFGSKNTSCREEGAAVEPVPFMQTIFRGRDTKYFPVADPSTPLTKKTPSPKPVIPQSCVERLRLLRGGENSRSQPSPEDVNEEENQRLLDAFLAASKFLDLLKGVDRTSAACLVRPANKSNQLESSIERVVEYYLERSRLVVPHTAAFILRRLQGAGSREPGLDFFRPVQEQKTEKKYAVYVSRLILMLVRQKSSPYSLKVVVLPSNLEECVANFLNILTPEAKQATDKRVTHEVLEAVHEIHKALFLCRLPYAASTAEFPLKRFIVFSSLVRAKGLGKSSPMSGSSSEYRLKRAREQTQGLAILQYAIRCTALMCTTIGVTTDQEIDRALKFINEDEIGRASCRERV